MDTVENIAISILKAGEFIATREVHSTRLMSNKDNYYGTINVKKCEISRHIDTCGEYSGAEYVYTVAMRCMGTECGYRDTAELERRVNKTLEILADGSGYMIRNIVRGELERCALTGRLERTIIFTIAGYERSSLQ